MAVVSELMIKMGFDATALNKGLKDVKSNVKSAMDTKPI